MISYYTPTQINHYINSYEKLVVDQLKDSILIKEKKKKREKENKNHIYIFIL